MKKYVTTSVFVMVQFCIRKQRGSYFQQTEEIWFPFLQNIFDVMSGN